MTPNEALSGITAGDVRRFWSKVDRGGPDDCWRWQGTVTTGGYGTMRLTKGGRAQVTASRIAFYVATGHHPGDLFVCHRCDNPICVNPAHLFVGSQKDNMQDCAIKGRCRTGDLPKGLAHHNARLDPLKVRAIRGRVRGGESMASVARAHGVSETAISRVVQGITWRHVS